MQKNHILRNSMLAAAILLVCFFCWSMVRSNDLLRRDLLSVREQLKTMQETINDLSCLPLPVQQEKNASSDPHLPVANQQYYDKNAQPGGRIIFASGTDFAHLNPITSCDAYVSDYWSFVTDHLAEPDYNDPNLYRPMIAESWTVSPDNLTWKIQLRKGVLWHDFTDPVTKKEWKNIPVTAQDFKFYIDVIKDEKVDAQHLRGYFAGIRDVNVLNDYEFEVIWREPYFLSKDITLDLTPLPRHLYMPDGKFDGTKFNDDVERNKIMVGCGPYRFVRKENCRRLLLVRNEKYYGRSLGIQPAIKQISFDIIKHPGTRLQALVSGDLDSIELTPDQWINNTSGKEFDPKTGSIRKLMYPAHSYNYIGMNRKNVIFQEKEVRQALSHLVNRERIIRDVYFGLARPISGPFFPDSPANDPSVKPYDFSMEKAKKLLDEAGWRDSDGDGIREKNGRKLKFTILYPNGKPVYQKLLSILKEDFAKAGVCVDSLALEWPVVLEKVDKRRFDAVMIGWTIGMRPDPFQLWHSSTADNPVSSNFISFKNKEADKLIEAIRVEFDDAKREKLYHAFHRLIYDDAPYIFLFSPYKLMGISSRYQNVRLFPGGIPDRILWTPKNQQKQVPGF